MVLSALMNASGGLLILSLNSLTSNTALDLDAFQKHLTEETLIPQSLFMDCVKVSEDRDKAEIYLFVCNAKRLVTASPNAYRLDGRYVALLTDNDKISKLLQYCSCEDDFICTRHEDMSTSDPLSSLLPGTDQLKVGHPFPSVSRALYRHYQLNSRSLVEVLNTRSVMCEIMDLASALANTKGGSIFLGVTDMEDVEHSIAVKGYAVSGTDEYCVKSVTDIITGKDAFGKAIWEHPKLDSSTYWKVFLHDVTGEEGMRKVIEIRIRKCPGGMFVDLPICLYIDDPGQIYCLSSFDEWKSQRKSEELELESEEVELDFYRHFVSATNEDTSPEEGTSQLSTAAVAAADAAASTLEDTATTSPEFCWWQHEDSVISESLQFDMCCAKDLADNVIDIKTKFSVFPSIEAVTERQETESLKEALQSLVEEHEKQGRGAAVVIEGLRHVEIETYLPLGKIPSEHHICDFVVVKAGMSQSLHAASLQ